MSAILAQTTRRPWTPREVELLRRDYRERPLAEVCALLWRTPPAVQQAARRYGVVRSYVRCTPELLERLRQLHEQGKSDGGIARALGVSVTSARKWRLRLGLPPTRPVRGSLAGSEEFLAEQRRRDSAARAAGYQNYGHWMLIRRRLHYLAQWPGCTTKHQVELCRLLAQRGPMTLHEAAAALPSPSRRRSRRQAAQQLLREGVLQLDALGRLVLPRRYHRPSTEERQRP